MTMTMMRRRPPAATARAARAPAMLALAALALAGCVRADLVPPDAAAITDGAGEGAAATDVPAAPDVVADRAGDSAADGRGDGIAREGGGGPDGRDGGGGDLGGDGRGDGGAADVPAPTCSDHIQNSDETDVDCGGHCGKCAPGKTCIIGVDCIFGVCKPDHTCGACSVAADCAGVESECVHRSCTAGVCGTTKEPAGTVLSLQTTGDCKRRQCAADGTVAVVNDDSDLPDDHNSCINDFCMSGVPSHAMLPVDSPCGGIGHCNGTGECVGCVAASDCPGADTSCAQRTCSAGGVCGVNLQPAGTWLTDPTPHDCKGVQCDGKGNLAVVSDDTDLPVDGNPCTTDECSGGTPAHHPVGAGTGCGGAMVCDGANRCVQCVSTANCPGTDTECHTRTCIDGQCGVSNSSAGTVTTAQTPGDCKRHQCDGQGGVTDVADNADVPVDGVACTLDVCTGTTPSNPPAPSGTGCGGTSVCDGMGACVGCVTAATCPGTDTECHTRTCINHTCGVSNTVAGTALFSQVAGDCKRSQCDGNGNIQMVTDPSDVFVDGNPCTADLCTDGAPSNPLLPSGSGCGTGLLCNDAGACVGCRVAADCAGTDSACRVRTCSPAGQCGVSNIAAGTVLATQTPGDCRRDQCDGSGGVATVSDDTDRPVDGNSCTQDLCTSGLPSNPPEPKDTPCAQNGGSFCNGLAGSAACVQCNQAAECPGGPDTECRVRTCSAAGACGVSFTAGGTVLSQQTPGDCKRLQCDGGGQVVAVADASDRPVDGNGCTKDLCTGSTPSNPFEAPGTPCSENGGALCNGAGVCVQCQVAADCPGGPDTECSIRTCSAAGACGTNLVASGTALSVQTPGDCRRAVCDGMGGVGSVNDDTDVFVDGNGCTKDVCIGGAPANPPVVRGTMCTDNGGSLCDGKGTCVQCLTDAQCDTSHDQPCLHTHCVTGACMAVPDPLNTPLPDPIPGDCQGSACNGAGGVTSVPDDTDAPASMNPCVSMSCQGGVPTSQNIGAGTSCSPDGTMFCDGAGNCS
jgi:hypothetical protein